MTAVLVQGLSGEGPGDIVGAFVNECGIAPEAIGEIEIDGDEATVALDDGVVDDVVREMDGETVGTSTVSVVRLDEATETARSYVDRYRELVELERQAEMERHESEIRSLSGREREAKGRALLHMRGRDEGEGLGGYLVKFSRQRRDEELPETEIGVGDLVMLSKQDPLRDDNPTGTVAEKTRYSITVAFDGRPPGFVFDDGLRVDLYVNDITFQRMQDALQQLPDADGSLAGLRDVIVGVEEPDPPEPARIDTWHNESLNDSQRNAVRRAVGAERFHLIHGPPGTGKTTTAIEVIEQAVDRGGSVLATAASNTAVDTLLEFLIDRGVDAVRVGHPARVTPTLREHTLDSRLEDHPKYQRRSELREEAFDLLDEQEQYTHPSGRWRRGLSDERIKSLAEEGRGARGVPPEKIQEMAEWLELQEQADELFEEADRLEQEAITETIEEADVVCTTNSTSGSDLLEGAQFDLLVIDEATQATEPSCLIPITHADRVVMAGDHRQLPPTVQSEEAAREGLRETLFERLAERHPRILDMLRVQYRMHETIMGFSSERCYGGELEAAPSVAAHTLSDLEIDPTKLTPQDILDPAAPLVFVDTADLDAPERQRSGSTSRENPTEAAIVTSLAESLLEAGVDPTDIAVISPYDDQVDRLSSELGVDALEVDTVDGFQGREKEVVLVSLVRSNERGEIGFLAEERRFNVAVTRAKRKVVVVGDRGTVTQAPVFEAFVDYAEDAGRIVRQ